MPVPLNVALAAPEIATAPRTEPCELNVPPSSVSKLPFWMVSLVTEASENPEMVTSEPRETLLVPAGLTSGNNASKLFAGELLATPALQFAAFVQEPSVWPVQVVLMVPADSL